MTSELERYERAQQTKKIFVCECGNEIEDFLVANNYSRVFGAEASDRITLEGTCDVCGKENPAGTIKEIFDKGENQ